MPQTVEAIIGGRPLTIETGKFAEQADGAVTVQYGDTAILVTVCATKPANQRFEFFPLTVDYEERLYAAGKIPGCLNRRSLRASRRRRNCGPLDVHFPSWSKSIIIPSPLVPSGRQSVMSFADLCRVCECSPHASTWDWLRNRSRTGRMTLWQKDAF